MIRNNFNGFRYEGEASGFYESYFQRANHPSRKLAFWIRYTFFVPKGRPRDAVGELWAIYFDGEQKRITPVKVVVPVSRCLFNAWDVNVRIGESTLDASSLHGSAEVLGHSLAWDLRYASSEQPLFLLPERLYDAPFPKAKALVGSPLARFTGSLTVDGEQVDIADWVGSQNHNWGSKHTDEYAWGQVAGFDGSPSTFLELSTARVHLGPLKTPWLSPIVLRHEGQEYRWNAIRTALRAKAKYEFFHWTFDSTADGVRIHGTIDADAGDFVGLPYDNPPGGRKTCLNSKVARCSVTLERRGSPPLRLYTANRAAFEILTTRADHGVPVLAV